MVHWLVQVDSSIFSSSLAAVHLLKSRHTHTIFLALPSSSSLSLSFSPSLSFPAPLPPPPILSPAFDKEVHSVAMAPHFYQHSAHFTRTCVSGERVEPLNREPLNKGHLSKKDTVLPHTILRTLSHPNKGHLRIT